MSRPTIVYLLFILFAPSCLLGANKELVSDTIPPMVQALPSDTIISCNTAYTNVFNNWITDQAGLLVTDTGDFNYFNTFGNTDLDQAISSSSDTLCGVSAHIPVGFYAIDDCNNSTDTLFANFIIQDFVQPMIQVQAQAKNINCVPAVLDSLQQWLDQIGGAVALDQCGTIQWDNYIWNDNLGNSGFSQVDQPTNINIDLSNCSWSVNVSFFVLDECENINATTSSFGIIDMEGPNIIDFVSETSINCEEELQDLEPIFIDNCDDQPVITMSSSNDQGTNPNECDFYQYEIINTFTATDACGNSNSFEQRIEVKDELSPVVIASETITIDCQLDLNDPMILLDTLIDCSPILINFTDSILNASICNKRFKRSWTFEDVCGNVTDFAQIVSVIDQLGPEVGGTVPNLEMACLDNQDFVAQMDQYLELLLAIESFDNCSQSNITVLQGAVTEDYFKFQFEPKLRCENEPIFQEENVSLVLEDECGNVNFATSNIQVIDTIPPIITDCPAAINQLLIGGNCEAVIVLTEASFENGCNLDHFAYYFENRKSITIQDSSNLDKINFNWEFEYSAENIFETGAYFNLSLHGFQDSAGQLAFSLVDQQDSEIFLQGLVDQNCNSFDQLNISIPDDIAQQWLQDETIELELRWGIENLGDCNTPLLADLKIVIPTRLDNAVNHFYQYNNEAEQAYEAGDQLSLTAGIHELNLIIEDCGGNRTSCIQIIEIVDQEIPSLVCPADQTIALDADSCSTEILINPIFQFVDNCENNSNVTLQEPSNENRFLLFNQTDDGTFIAQNLSIPFLLNPQSSLILNPTLEIEMLVNSSAENAFFIIEDEDGNTLGQTKQTEDNCDNTSITSIDLNPTDIKQWAADGEVILNLINPVQNGLGLEPCSPTDFEDQSDQISFLFARISYTEVSPDLRVIDLGSNEQVELFNQKGIFSPGEYEVTLSTFDISGNQASCQYAVTVEDISPPVLNCVDVQIEIEIGRINDLVPTPELLNIETFDNCGQTTFELDSPNVDCENIGNAVNAILSATDQFGNQSSCAFPISVVGKELEPDFITSLCGSDTLLLLNNITLEDPSLELNYEWNGPLSFSSEQANPQILGANENNSGTYQLIVTDLAGCIFSGEVEVLIESLNVPSIINDENILCEGEIINMTATGFSGNVSYQWYEGIAPNGSFIGQSEDGLLTLNPDLGPHNYYVVVDGDGCVSDPSEEFSLEVIAQPMAMVVSSFIADCEGSTVALQTNNVNPTLLFEWKGPNGYASFDANPPAFNNLSNTQQGTYELIVTDRGCVSDPTTVEIIVFPTPDLPIITGQSVLCQGSELSLSVPNIVTADKYLWSLNGTLYSTTNTNTLIIPSAQDQLSGDWTVIVEDGSCQSIPSSNFEIEIESQIMVGATNNGPTCEGAEVTLTASFIPNADYTWITPNNQEFNDRIVTVPVVEGLYIVEVITDSGCIGSTTTLVETTQVPEITALSNNSNACMELGEMIEFFPSIFPPGNYTYLWSGPNGFTSGDENLSIPFNGSTSQGFYSLQLNNENCLSEQALTEVMAQQNPPAPIITLQNNPCLGDPISISVSNVSAEIESYIWNTPIGQITTSEPLLMISASTNNNAGKYSLRVQTNGCISESSNEIDIQIGGTLSVPNIAGDSELCAGQSLVLEINNQIPGASYQWTLPNGDQFEGPILLIENFTLDLAGSYYAIAQVNGCNSEPSNIFQVSIIPGPPLPTLTADEFYFCLNELNQLSFDNFIELSNVDVYVLYNELGEEIGRSQLGSFVGLDLSQYDSGTYEFQLAASVDNCESELRATFLFIVETQEEEATFAADFLSFCELGLETIEINIPLSVDIEISFEGNGITIQAQNNNSLSINLIDFGMNQLILTSIDQDCGAFAIDTLSIAILKAPEAVDDAFVISSVADPILILANDDFIDEITISLIGSIDPAIELIDNELILNSNLEPGNYEFTYEICYVNCSDQCDQANILIELVSSGASACDPYNLITPNGDGINDAFVIPCLSATDIIELSIYDARGRLVYETENYKNDWEGIYNAERLPVGTYYYYLNRNSSSPENGFIIIED